MANPGRAGMDLVSTTAAKIGTGCSVVGDRDRFFVRIAIQPFYFANPRRLQSIFIGSRL